MELTDDNDGRVRYQYEKIITTVDDKSLIDTLDDYGHRGWDIASSNIFHLPAERLPVICIILKKPYRFDPDTMRFIKEALAKSKDQDE